MKSLKEQLYDSLAERHNTMICRLCHLYSIGDTYRYGELRQEVALALWREIGSYGLSRFRRRSSEKTWVYRIALHAIYDYERRYGSRVPTVRLGDSEPESLAASDSEAMQETLDEFFALLTPDDRRLLMLSLEGYDYQEMAAMEQTTAGAIGSHLTRIRNKLKKNIQ